MKIKRILRLIALVIVGFSLVACTKKESSPPQSRKGLKIVTSFYPIYSMVKEVSGDLNDVRMIQSSSDGFFLASIDWRRIFQLFK